MYTYATPNVLQKKILPPSSPPSTILGNGRTFELQPLHTHRFPIKLKAISRQDVFQITRELDHMNLNLLQLAVTSSKRNTKHRSCSGGGSVITRHQSCGSGDSLHTLGRSSENGGLVALPQFWPDQRCWITCDMRRGVATRSWWKIANSGFSFDMTMATTMVNFRPHG